MLNRNCFKGGLGDGPMILKPSTNSAASFVGKSKQYDDNIVRKVFELNLKSAKNCVFLPLELSLTFAEDPTHIVKIK